MPIKGRLSWRIVSTASLSVAVLTAFIHPTRAYANDGYPSAGGIAAKTYVTRGPTWNAPTDTTDEKGAPSGGSVGAYALPSLPSGMPWICPSGAHYDNPSASCRCSPGFISTGATCVSGLSGCIRNYGPYAQYDDLSKGCTCQPGYAWNASRTTCIDQTISCRKRLGANAYYDVPSSNCKCGAGSVYDPALARCVPGSLWCVSKYGNHVTHDPATRQCACTPGYLFDQARNGCVDGASLCKQLHGTKAEYDQLTNTCEWCDDGYLYSQGACLPVPGSNELDAPPVPSSDPNHLPAHQVVASSFPAPKVDARKAPMCEQGLILGFNGKTCVKIPEHAHPATGSKTDLWRCDDGYEEIGNACRRAEIVVTSRSAKRQLVIAPVPQPKSGTKTWLQNVANWFKG